MIKPKHLFRTLAAIVSGLLAAGLFWFLSGTPAIEGNSTNGLERSVSFNAPLRFEFTQWMDQESVERAITFAPETSGTFEWEGLKTLLFTPNEPFTIGEALEVTIAESAENWIGREMQTAYSFRFLFVGAPEVTFIAPISPAEWQDIKAQQGSSVLNIESNMEKAITDIPVLQKGERISLLFDRPIRALESFSEGEETLDNFGEFLEFTPELPGSIRFLGTSGFEFVPTEESFPMGQHFTAQLKQGAPIADGGVLTSDIIWHFDTPAPEIVSISPANHSEFISPRTKIRVEWNQPVDEESFFDRVRVTPDLPSGEARKLSVEWDRDEDPNAIFISFEPYFPQGETVVVQIDAGVKSLQGERSSLTSFQSSFQTLRDAGLASTTPKNGGTMKPEDSFILRFTSPMDPEQIKEHLIFEPAIPKENISVWQDYGESAINTVSYAVSAPFTPQTNYRWELNAGLSDNRLQIINEQVENGLLSPLSAQQKESLAAEALLETPLSGSFRTGDFAPFLTQLTRSGEVGVYDSTEPTGIFIQHRNIGTVEMKACPIPTDRFISTELHSESWWPDPCGFSDEVVSWAEELSTEKNSMKITEIDLRSHLDMYTGIYAVQFSSPEYRDYEKKIIPFSHILVVANATLTAKFTDEGAFLWATDFREGKPIDGMQIELFERPYEYNNRQITKTGTAVTNREGIAEIQLPAEKNFAQNYMAIARKGDLFSLVGIRWNEGIDRSDFGIESDWREHPFLRGYVYTDRPIYRPGQEVFVKGIVRSDQDATLTIPAEEKFTVIVQTPQGDELFKKPIALSAQGTFATTFSLLDTAEVGNYVIIVRPGDESTEWSPNEFYRSFAVEEYRQPDFRVGIVPLKDGSPLIASSTPVFLDAAFDFEISGEYYFGGALTAGSVEYTVVREPYYFHEWQGTGWYSFSNDQNFCWWDCTASEVTVTSGKAALDSVGKFLLPVSTDFKWQEGEKQVPQLVTVYTTLEDASGRRVSATETIVVYAADGFVGIRPENFFLPSGTSTIPFETVVTTRNGETRGDEKVEIELAQIQWNSIQKEGVDGGLYWQSSKERTVLDTVSTQTDSSGVARISFPIRANDTRYNGELEAVAHWTDANGNRAEAAKTVYRAAGNDIFWRPENNDRIPLTLDKKSYAVGDVAKVLVPSPFSKPVSALVTIERKNILETKVTTVQSGEFLEIPVTADMVPNAFVSVVLIKGKGLLGEWQNVTSSLEKNTNRQQQLEEQLPENQQKLSSAQAEAAFLSADTSAQDRRRIETRITVLQERITEMENEQTALQSEQAALESQRNILMAQIPEEDRLNISEATAQVRPEMKIGMTPLAVNIDEKELQLILTPEKEEYLPGETVSLTVETRDHEGSPVAADISLAVVDESILALRSRNLENIVDFFWGYRPLGVWTSNTLVYFLERINVRSQDGSKGGGGGLDADDLARRKRGEFRDTAFWIPDLKTNASGKTEIEFTLPDNLTSWEIWGVAATPDTKVGVAKKSFVSRKELMVQPALPRFATVGDTFTSAFQVHNQTDIEEEFTVTLQAENFVLSEENGAPKTITIPAQSSRMVEFSGTVAMNENTLSVVSPLRLTVTAHTVDEFLRDEVSFEIPLQTPAIGEFIATSGETSTEATEYLRIPAAALKNIGGATISLVATRITPFLAAWDSLHSARFENAEQIMSRILPQFLLQQLEKTLGSADFARFAPFAESIDLEAQTTALQKLQQLQRSDGGFGYWQESPSPSPYLSAYILYGLVQAKNAGVAVDSALFTELQEYVRSQLRFSRPAARDENGDALMTEIAPEEQELHQRFGSFTDSIDANTRSFLAFALAESGTPDIISDLNRLYTDRSELTLSGKIFLWMALQRIGAAPENQNVLQSEIEASVRQTARGAQFEETEASSPWSMDSNLKTTALALMALNRKDPDHPLLPKIVNYLSTARAEGRYPELWGSTQNTAWILAAYLEYFQAHNSGGTTVNGTVEVNGEPWGSATFPNENSFEPITLPPISLEALLKSPQLNAIDIRANGENTLFYDLTAEYFLPPEAVKEVNNGIGIVRNYYHLNDEKMENPVQTAELGETLRAKLTILVPETRHFVAVQEKLPAGLEPINFDLSTADQSLLLKERQQLSENSYWHWWNNLWHFSHREMRDDEILLFADVLPAGVYEYHFYASAGTVGTFQHLPATVEEIYTPEVFGRTNGNIFEVTAEN